MPAPKVISKNKRRNDIAVFWILVAFMSAGMTFLGWNAENTLSRQLSKFNVLLTSEDKLPSAVRTLNIETRDKTGEGILDEPTTVVSGFKVEAFHYFNRLPSSYSLRSHSKVSKNYQFGILKLPNSQLALSQILRI